MANYLVTGAAGFIASKVCEQLLARNDRVVGVDNLNDAYDVRLKHWRLDRLKAHPRFQFVQADVTSEDAVRSIVLAESFEAVINLAARAGVRQSVLSPHDYIDTNITGTLNLLRAAVERRIPKFVLASTSSLYGHRNPLPYDESLETDHPLSPYAASKKAAEALCYTYHHLFGIDVTVLRYFTVYGPAGRPDMSPFRFVQWVTENRPVRIFGDGRQRRDFTYVDDIASGTLAAIKPVGYEVINLGNDTPVELIDMLRKVEQLTGKSANIVYEPMHQSDMSATWASIEKAKSLLDWRPTYDLASGLARLVDWYAENRSWAREIATAN